MGSKYIRMGPVADSVPFDNENNPNCKLTSDTVQEALEALCVNNPANSLISVHCLHLSCGLVFDTGAQLINQTPCFLKSEEC